MSLTAEKHTPGILATAEVLQQPLGAHQLEAFLAELGVVPEPDQSFWGEYPPQAVIIATSSNRKAQALKDALTILYGEVAGDNRPSFDQPLEYMMWLRAQYWNGNKAFPTGMQYLGMLSGVPIIMQATDGESGAHGAQKNEAFNKLDDVRQHYAGCNVFVMGLDGEDEFVISRQGETHVTPQGKLSGKDQYPFPATQREFSTAELQTLESWFRHHVLKSLFDVADDPESAWLVSVTAVAAKDALDEHSAEATAVLPNQISQEELLTQLLHAEPQAPLGGLQQFVWFAEERTGHSADKNFQAWVDALPAQRRYQAFFELLTIIGVPMHAILEVIQTLIADRSATPNL